MRASEFTKQELDEKVNPRVVEPGFTAEKRLGNRYVMKAEARYTGEPGDDLRGLIIKVYDTKARPTMLNWGIGMTRFVARQDPTTQDWYLVSSTTHVDDRYQRQGLASAMYNWARELGNDIEPSSNRTKMGKHFWEKGAGAGREFVDQPPETAAPPAIPTSTAAGPAKAQSLRDRLIKMFTEEPAVTEGLTEYKNTPLQDYNGLQFMIDSNHPYLRVEAFAPGSGQQLAQVDFKIDDQDELHPEDLHVEERWRGQGIAQIMYDFVKSKGYTIHRSWSQTDAGAGFWDKHRGEERVWEQDDSEAKSHDFMAGHCHVMALALKQLHPDWQIRAHVGWDDDEADDTEYRVDHVYTVAPDGTAYDCRGKFDNEQQLVGPDTTGGVDTQYVNFGPEEIKQAMLRGELKRFSKQDLANAMQTATQAGKQDVSEAPAGYKEIEFVCVNPQFPDATDPALQKKMYRGLKQIDGVVPLWQEWGDYSEGQASLSAIYQGSKNRDKILSLAKQLGVEVDLEQAVSADYVDRAMRGEHEGQQGLTEEINPDCFDPAFNDTQIFDGLTYRATVDEEYGKPVLTIRVLDDNFQQAGLAKFKQSTRGVVSLITSFRPEYQGQGLARNIYAYVRAMGNTIVPSRNQLPPGKAMWAAWKKSGDAKHLMTDVAENFADGQNPVKFTVTTPDGYTHSFQITLAVHGKRVGHFNFVRDADTDDVNNEAEVESRWQGQGYGKLLLMKAIDVANNHRLDFQQDIRGITNAQQNVYDSLENDGLIVTPGDGFWFLTPQGEQELNGLNENFADGKHPEDKGDSKRHGVPTKSSVSNLRKFAKSHSGRAAQLAHWAANMKAGRAKKKKTNETVIGTLHFPKLIIAVDDHAIDRTRTRGISPATIDQSLRKLNGIADQLGQMESSNTVWVYDVSNNIALGLRRTSSQGMRFTLKTVVADRPFDGTTPIIELT